MTTDRAVPLAFRSGGNTIYTPAHELPGNRRNACTCQTLHQRK
jgi:hypothetical protein